MEKDDLLLAKLIQYGNSDIYPFHMPGHKRQVKNQMLRNFPNPFAIDITEVDGFDNLHHPEGILKESMEWAASVYGSDRTYYLVNGSSSGILSAICAATYPGGKILMGRNCHKSAYHGVILNGLHTAYIYPQSMGRLGIQGGILADDVEKRLKDQPDIEAVLVVSPTYDGIVSDIRGIADVVHSYGIPLIVDEAHGAHFSFGKGQFPVSALECGADVVVQSLHKTLPSLTQTAVLHVKYGYINPEKLNQYLQIFQSSSPSYVFMSAIERCIYEMAKCGQAYMQEFAIELRTVRQRLKAMRNLRLLDESQIGEHGIFAIDPGKIVVSCKNCIRVLPGGLRAALNGSVLSDWLRTEFHLELEMCGADYVVAIVTYLDREEGLLRLADAFLEIDKTIDRRENKNQESKWDLPIIQVKLAEAVDSACEELWLKECAGRISAEFIYLYPPGIPIVAPGELVTDEIVRRIMNDKRMGLTVQGMADRNGEKLRVLK